MTSPKTLLLVRHAKSCWKDSRLADIDRPLNKRGQRDAPEMGRRLRARSLVPERIVSSPAVRALTTARTIAEATGYDDDVVIDDELYGAFPADVLDTVSYLPGDVHIAMVVGHNPTMTDLANQFADESIDNVPTCGVLILEVPEWFRVNEACLVDFDYPKRLE